MRDANNSELSGKKIKVGVITTSFPITSGSVSGIFVERLFKNMPERVDVTVLVPSPNAPPREHDNKKYKLQFFSYGPKCLQRLTHQPGGIPDAIRRKDPIILLIPLLIPALFLASLRLAGKVDVIHGNWSGPGVIAALAARLRRKPVIITLRGADANRAAQSLLSRGLLKACLIMSYRCTVVSMAMLQALRELFPKYKEKLQFVPNGVSISPRPQAKPFSTPTKIITVGSLIQRKRIDTIIHAVADLSETHPVTLTIIGGGPEEKKLKELVRLTKSKCNFNFLGPISPEQIEGYLHDSDIFVLASESEGRPNSLLEAMASGLPIVATSIPGVRELIEPSGGTPLYSRKRQGAC